MNEKTCRICIHSRNIKKITFPCECQIDLHIRCLQNWLLLQEQTCPNCMKNFRSRDSAIPSTNIDLIHSPKVFIENTIRRNIDTLRFEESNQANTRWIDRFSRRTFFSIFSLFFILILIFILQRLQ
jgi:hypothetical protein